MLEYPLKGQNGQFDITTASFEPIHYGEEQLRGLELDLKSFDIYEVKIIGNKIGDTRRFGLTVYVSPELFNDTDACKQFLLGEVDGQYKELVSGDLAG